MAPESRFVAPPAHGKRPVQEILPDGRAPMPIPRRINPDPGNARIDRLFQRPILPKPVLPAQLRPRIPGLGASVVRHPLRRDASKAEAQTQTGKENTTHRPPTPRKRRRTAPQTPVATESQTPDKGSGPDQQTPDQRPQRLLLRHRQRHHQPAPADRHARVRLVDACEPQHRLRRRRHVSRHPGAGQDQGPAEPRGRHVLGRRISEHLGTGRRWPNAHVCRRREECFGAVAVAVAAG